MATPKTGPLHVVKIGGSVLPDVSGFARAAAFLAEMQSTRPLVVVVSAQRGHTDALELEFETASPDASAAERATHLATGEMRSGELLVAALEEAGVAAELVAPVDVFLLAGDPRCATISEVRTAAIERVLDSDRVPVVPGFIGTMATGGEPATMGRGGGDLSAVALACALGAERAVLVKGAVTGLFTHDPARNPLDAVLIESMTHLDVFEIMDRDGVEVIHSDALHLARERGVTIQVRGIEPGDGTVVRSA